MLKFSHVLAVVVVALSVLATLILAARPKWHQLDGYTFEQYIQDFRKPHKAGTAEFAMRKKVFYAKLQKIKAINNDATLTWKAGVNMFTDMTDAEWKRFNGFKKSAARPAAIKVHAAPAGYAPPRTRDWRDVTPSIISPVKHQGSCGSCWAHSAVESMETYYALATGHLPVLAAGQMNSCTPAPGAYGCDGGDYVAGWMSINATQQPPITEEWCYPYEDFFFPTSGNAPTAACYNISSKFINKKPYDWFAELTQVGINGYAGVTANSWSAAMYAIAEVGPQSISVAAGNWQWYEEGVFTNTPANGEDNEWSIDHAVYMIGYGVDTVVVNGTRQDTGYWLVQNSWSTNWGDAGYIKLWRSLNGNEPCSPAAYGPVCGTSGCLSDLAAPIINVVKPLPF